MTTKSTSNERKKKKKDEFEIVRIKNFCAKEVKTIIEEHFINHIYLVRNLYLE